MRLWLMALLAVLLPVCTSAGPWPRERGETFVSLSYRASGDIAAIGKQAPDHYTSVYVERGLARRLTFGLDGGYARDGAYSGIFFLRHPVGTRDSRWLLAMTAGAGVAGGGGAGTSPESQIVVGGSAGRGFTLGRKSGWATLDLSATRRLTTGIGTLKADLTVGLRPAHRWMTIVQVQSGLPSDGSAWLRLAPSLVREIAPGRHISIGLDADLLGSGTVGLTLASWIEF